MNNKRRKQIESVRTTMDELIGEIESICEEEQDAFDNLPESLQESSRGEKMSEAIDSLNSARDSLEEANSSLEEAAQ